MTEKTNTNRGKTFLLTCFILVLSGMIGLSSGILGSYIGLMVFGNGQPPKTIEEALQQTKIVQEESAIIDVVEKTSDAVVSIIITKDIPKIETYYDKPFGEDFPFQVPRYRENGTEEQQIGAGSGFLVSSDGYIVSNRHVVEDEEASYTALLNDGTKMEAKVLALDTVLDIAILKIDRTEGSYISLGDSDSIKTGQRVIAIGNALGEFQNTVSEGIVSGLSRSIIASSGLGQSESLDNIIQTDASINPGNSGGPLLDYGGNVIGVNVAVAQNAENIGFAIPINEVKKIISSVIEFGEIRRPYIGVRFIPIDESVAKSNNLNVDYGVLLVRGDSASEPAIIPGSPADKAGLLENDIILEVNGEKVKGSLQKIIQKYDIGQKIDIKVLSKGEEKQVSLTLEMQP